jgi:hypothetical protein
MIDSSESKSSLFDAYGSFSLSDSSLASLVQQGIEKMSAFQKFAIDCYSYQTVVAIGAWKKLISPPVFPEILFFDAASQSMESFIDFQKKLVDLIAHQSMATLGQAISQPADPPDAAVVTIAEKTTETPDIVAAGGVEVDPAESDAASLSESEEPVCARNVIEEAIELLQEAPLIPKLQPEPIKAEQLAAPAPPKEFHKAGQKPRQLVVNSHHAKKHQSGKPRNHGK